MALKYLMFQFPGLPGIHCLFQGRSSAGNGPNDKLAGNISFLADKDHNAVLASREELFRILQAKGMEAWSECHQVHGETLIVEPRGTRPSEPPDILPAADGLCGSRPGLGLMIKTADCQPILLAHKSGKFIMALHVGWRGNRLAFPVSAVGKFCQHFRIKAEDILAVRGPSLGPAASEFINFAAEWGGEYEAWHDPVSKCVDLWALSRWQLGQAGLKDRNIYELDICTFINDGEYFSFRRDKNTGRQASVIWMEKG